MSPRCDRMLLLERGHSRPGAAGFVERKLLPSLPRSRPTESAGIWLWILQALRESRSREAARLIQRHRRLMGPDRGS
jgi:hypothetical protein